MINLLLILLGSLGVWGIGLTVAQLALRQSAATPQSQSNLAELLGLGLVWGFGINSLFYFLWGITGSHYSQRLAVSWMGVGIVLGMGTLFTRFRAFRRESKSVLKSISPEENHFRNLCVVILIFLTVSTLFQTLMTPQRFWDERAIFGLKSIVIFQEGTIQTDVLHDPDFVQYHPKYPLLIPLNEAHFYFLMGEVNDRWSKVLFPLLYLGMVLTFLGVLLRTTQQLARSWLFALMLATVPAMVPWEYGFISGQADGPVACFHTVTLLYLWSFLYLKTHALSVFARSPAIAGLTAGMTIFTKDEGIAFFLVELIALSIVALLYFRNQLTSLVISLFQFGFVTLLVIVPWFSYRSQLPSTTEMAYFSRMQITTLAEGFSAISWALKHLFQVMFLEAGKWGLQWWAFVISLCAFPKKVIKPYQLFIMLNILGELLALIIAGMIAPTPVQEHIGGSSLRFLLQISGGAMLFIAGQWMYEQD